MEGFKICPYCGGENYRKATRCRHCKEWLEDINEENKLHNELPKEIKKFNWGAFFLTWIWGIGNKSYWTFLFFPLFLTNIWFPTISWIILNIFYIIVGIKGNKWAWQNKEWENIKHFNNIQKKWAIAGTIISLVIAIAMIGINWEHFTKLINEENNNIQTSSVQTQTKNLELIEAYKCHLDYGAKGVCGTIKNNSLHTYKYAEISINLYDYNGNLIGNTLSNINNFKPNKYWKFQAPVIEYNATSFEVEEISGF